MDNEQALANIRSRRLSLLPLGRSEAWVYALGLQSTGEDEFELSLGHNDAHEVG